MAPGGVWREALLGLVVALCVGVVAGAPAAMQPSSSDDSEVGCARPLVDVVWGFLLTLLAIVVASWTSTQHYSPDKSGKMLWLSVAVSMPFVHLQYVLVKAYLFTKMVSYCYTMKYGKMSLRHVCSLLNPCSKSPLRILCSCDIIIYIKKRNSSPEEFSENEKKLHETWIWNEKVMIEDESNGMVIGEDGSRGSQTKIDQYERKEFTAHGTFALIWGQYFDPKCEEYRFIPEYDELKYLRGNSGFAMIAIATQAIGYIYSVIFRSAKDLRVAPVEVIGLIFNVLLLIVASLHSFSNVCVRPLIIYMDEERERKFVSILNSRPENHFIGNFYGGKVYNYGVGIISLFICIPILIYYIISLKNATNLMITVPLVIFGVSIIMSIIFVFSADRIMILGGISLISTLVLSIVSYVWALVVTLHYWESHHFDTRPKLLNLSQIIPFIG